MPTSAQLNPPIALVVSPTTGALFVSDEGNSCIRRVVIGNSIETVCGQCTHSGGGGGTCSAPRFNNPRGLVLDGDLLYVTDKASHLVQVLRLPPGKR